MLILITKDGATKVPKEVASLEEAKGFADMGFHVAIMEDGVEKPLVDMLAAVEAGFDSIEEHRAALEAEAEAEAAAAAAAAAAAQNRADAEKAVADAEAALQAADTDEAKEEAAAVLETARAALAALG